MNAFFTNSQRPVVGCLTIAAGILARSEGVSKGTGADQRFVKNAFKNAECHPFSYKYFFFLTHTCNTTTNQNFAVEIQP